MKGIIVAGLGVAALRPRMNCPPLQELDRHARPSSSRSRPLPPHCLRGRGGIDRSLTSAAFLPKTHRRQPKLALAEAIDNSNI